MLKLFRRKRNEVSYFAHNFFNVLAIVLIWRSMWYCMDFFDRQLFGGSHVITVVFGVVAGFSILYLIDRDLSQLEKL